MPTRTGQPYPPGVDGTLIGAAAAGLGVAVLTTPAGVSGAVFLLPVQLGLLGVPNPAATPTNLLYNVLATPGGLLRWARTGAVDARLAGRLAAAALPGVAAGAALRATVLSGRLAVLLMVGCVLAAMGAWLLITARASPPAREGDPAPAAVAVLAAGAGVVGGAYGIGGGSVIAPALVMMGVPVSRAAPAALATTLATSVAGIAMFEVLAVLGAGGGRPVAPVWDTGIALGLGGLAGTHAGAWLHGRAPERLLRAGLGGVALAVGLAHLVTAGG
ncbi:MAG: sulfite exporter TauE/SafE family protein [Thermoleophilia bacterium]|nr:sulfite exporter TauE/SafE family protein [Thermoleophilia bacterium]